jgi:YHS domain-containing protein
MYYFCSEQDRAAFAKDPTKYVLPAGEAAPAHAH